MDHPYQSHCQHRRLTPFHPPEKGKVDGHLCLHLIPLHRVRRIELIYGGETFASLFWPSPFSPVAVVARSWDTNSANSCGPIGLLIKPATNVTSSIVSRTKNKNGRSTINISSSFSCSFSVSISGSFTSASALAAIRARTSDAEMLFSELAPSSTRTETCCTSSSRRSCCCPVIPLKSAASENKVANPS